MEQEDGRLAIILISAMRSCFWELHLPQSCDDGLGQSVGQRESPGRITISSREIKPADGIKNTHIVDGRKGKLEGERRHALRELLLLCLGVKVILMLRARVLSDELVHDVRV